MNKKLFILFLIIPFIGFGQDDQIYSAFFYEDVGGTGWKIEDEDGDMKIILFEMDGTFTYLNVISNSGGEGKVYGDDDETWKVEDGNKITILFNNGYRILSGTINSKSDYMSGMSMNKNGLTEKWIGKLIEF